MLRENKIAKINLTVEIYHTQHGKEHGYSYYVGELLDVHVTLKQQEGPDASGESRCGAVRAGKRLFVLVWFQQEDGLVDEVFRLGHDCQSLLDINECVESDIPKSTWRCLRIGSLPAPIQDISNRLPKRQA